MSGFKKFLMRGNLIDLAVAVVVGVAFNAVVQSLVANIITPLLSAAGLSKVNFANLSVRVHGGVFRYGLFLNALISFLISATVVYFVFVAPTARLTELVEGKKAATTRDCPECLSLIPVAARRCMYCTSEVPPVEPPAADVPQPRRPRHGYLAPE
jgi:large conductance mechanosensitive channel